MKYIHICEKCLLDHDGHEPDIGVLYNSIAYHCDGTTINKTDYSLCGVQPKLEEDGGYLWEAYGAISTKDHYLDVCPSCLLIYHAKMSESR